MPQDSILHAAPISHGSGLYGLPHVARGAVSVMPHSGGVDGEEIAALLRRWPGMSFFAAPTMVKRLTGDPAVAAADLSNLKTIIYGGAPMYLADLEEALDVFGPRLAQIYGQGETPMTITALSKADHADRDHPRWRRAPAERRHPPAPTSRSASSTTTTATLPAGEVGEIVVRGDVVMAGYWKQPDATAETLRGGWLHTGDVGSFDDDGYLTLRDRSKDLIISGGMNIYPREVEEALLAPSRRPGRRRRRPARHGVGRGGGRLRRRRRGRRPAGGRGARPDVPRPHRPVQAAQGLPLRRRPADQQLRQGRQTGAARPAATAETRGRGARSRREEAMHHEARPVPAELPRQGDRQGARGPHRASPRSSTSTPSGRSTGSSSPRPRTAASCSTRSG